MSSSGVSALETLDQLQILAYVDVSAAVLVMYDYLLTFSGEVLLVWSSKWSAMKVLFFVNRYTAVAYAVFVFIGEISPVSLLISSDEPSAWIEHGVASPASHTCDMVSRGIAAVSNSGILAAELIILSRTWALWQRDRRVAVGLSLILATAFVLIVLYENKFVQSLKWATSTSSPSSAFHGCIVASGEDTTYVLYACIIVIETVVIALTMAKTPWKLGFFENQLSKVLYRDGLLYYLYFLALSLVNIITVLTAPPAICHVVSTLQGMLHTMLATRVVIHLRDAASSDSAKTLYTSEEIGGGLQFAPHHLLSTGMETSLDGQDNVSLGVFGLSPAAQRTVLSQEDTGIEMVSMNAHA
ncbi:uncharacterized protein STEHIDRAFT_167220 [Stereum hirsutum FP-91666 SS1]|uniref:uncharacterized protein n=1 Tax=Stereum hirsutum (strain FP-91666) TaxID=721885 RepID=UPI000440A82A|nr:uncharacterized protein STEHIDRAFT_167220 [Stereum hirsutum FP-91666 SS1]EIM87752.1 hypothetical protein STEHIDRAFT_167220 [Stereum hirsutum FP-91666 SS1]